MNVYWIKIALGIGVVSLPFLILALQKKISWQIFWTWTATSIFATLSFLFVQHAIEKNFDAQTKFFISMGVGVAFILIGFYMRSINSQMVRSMGWLFVMFGFSWALLSLPN